MIKDNIYIAPTCPECGEFLIEHDEGFMYCPLCSEDEAE